MKSFIVGAMLLLLSICLHAQSFEGVIVYKNTYTSKLPQVPDAQFNAMMGTTQEYSIKGGNYKSSTNGSFMQMQLYRQAENKLYGKTAMSDTLYWFDGNANPDEVTDFKILKNQEEILGVKCDAISVTTKTGSVTYYFNTKYGVDASLYKGHKFGNWFFLLEKSKSLPLKMIMETTQFKLVSLATEVRPAKLADALFNLPAGAVTKPSPF
jgi:hypothetical protein